MKTDSKVQSLLHHSPFNQENQNTPQEDCDFSESFPRPLKVICWIQEDQWVRAAGSCSLYYHYITVRPQASHLDFLCLRLPVWNDSSLPFQGLYNALWLLDERRYWGLLYYLKMGKILLKFNLTTKAIPNCFADNNDFCTQWFCYPVTKLNEQNNFKS